MRVRLLTRPPLPFLKAWYSIPASDDTGGATIRSLQEILCREFPVLGGATNSPDDLLLELDEFELRPDSNRDIIKEGEIIVLKLRRSVASNGASATSSVKRESTSTDVRPKAPLKRKARSPESSSSESSSSSEESAPIRRKPLPKVQTAKTKTRPYDDTSSSSESESDSSSESTSSSSSSSSSPTEIRTTRGILKTTFLESTAKPPLKNVVKREPQPEVPPGEGSVRTRKRNQRRRLVKRSAHSEDPSTIKQSPGALNEPNGASSSTMIVDSVAPISTLKNKNKKKGFQKSMENLPVKRIIFPDEDKADITQQPTAEFVPPSERKNLPSNMFVTWVDVELGRSSVADPDSSMINGTGEVKGASNGLSSPAAPLTDEQINWDALEGRWSSFIDVGDNYPEEGTIVGWKDLGIDPHTLTPKTMIHLGRVQEKEYQVEGSLMVKSLRRPGTKTLSFGMHIEEDGDESQGEVVTVPIGWIRTWKIIVV